MPKFRITDPYGNQYDVEGPEGSTEAEALSHFRSQREAGNVGGPEPAQTQAAKPYMTPERQEAIKQMAIDLTTYNPKDSFISQAFRGELPQMPQDRQEAIKQQAVDFTTFKPDNPVTNALKGVAASGNRAYTSINPLSTQSQQDRIAREQEWVNQHSGAGLGQIAGDTMMMSPIAGLQTLPARALATGAYEALTRPGDAEQRLTNLGLGTALGGLGEAGAKGVGFVAQPFKSAATKAHKKLVEVAQQNGIQLSAADISNNKSLQAADTALDYLPSSSGMQQTFKEDKLTQWQRAMLAKAGGDPDMTDASPEVLSAIKQRLTDAYDEIKANNSMVIDDVLIDKLNNIEKRYISRIPTDRKSIVKSYLDDFRGPFDAAKEEGLDKTFMSGDTYKDARSRIGEASVAWENRDPETANLLKDTQKAIDDAFNRSISEQDRLALRQADKQWAVLKTIESSSDPVTGVISPKRFLNAIKKREKNMVIYGKGPQDIVDLAKVGVQFISPKIGDSGTAQRAWWMKSLSPTSIGLGSGIAGGSNFPITAAAGYLAGMMVPRGAAHLMQNPNGYLLNGLVDMGANSAIPGMTRQGLMENIARPAFASGLLDATEQNY